jgi:hypothetical protein
MLAEGKVEVVERALAQKVEVAVADTLAHLRGLYDPRA